MLRSRFRCRLLLSSTLCSPPLASDVLGCCLLARRLTTIDVQVSESVDQRSASMCLRQHRRKKKSGNPHPGADVLFYSASPGSVTTFSGFGFCVVVAVGVSVHLGKAQASVGSSYAGLCKRWRPGRFRCGDHGVHSIASNASGTHCAISWRRRTARLLMTLAAVPSRCSLLSVSRPNQRPVTQGYGCRSWLTLAPGRRTRTCSPSGRISVLYFCPRIFSCGVTRVSLLTLYRVRTHAACLIVHGSIGERVVTSKNGIVFENCQICSSKTARCGDGLLRGAVALMALCQ